MLPSCQLHLLILPRGVPLPFTRSGSGVSSALRSKSKKGSWSTGDLQALAAEAEAELSSSGSGPVVSAFGSLSLGGSQGQGLCKIPRGMGHYASQVTGFLFHQKRMGGSPDLI